MPDPAITPELVQKHGLTPDEYRAHQGHPRARAKLYRTGHFLGDVERALLLQKHAARCSKLFPPNRPASWSARARKTPGIIDIGDGLAIAFKIESHNHPSAVEPFQGAATGVGGIIRDIFTMGARPDLRDQFAALRADHPGAKRRGQRDADRQQSAAFGGVVGGIAHYGNCFGIPTIAGEVYFDKSLRGQSAGQCFLPRRLAP